MIWFVASAGAVNGADCDAHQAKRLFVEGMKRLDAGAWDQACQRFEESLACHPRASTQAKVAGCREHDGNLTEALVAYQRALTMEVDPKMARQVASEIRALIEALEPRVPRLAITVAPTEANLEVTVNDRPVVLSPGTPLRVDPGEQRVVVDAPGFREERVTVTLVEGSSREVAIALTKLAAAPASEPIVGEASLPDLAPRAASNIVSLRMVAASTATAASPGSSEPILVDAAPKQGSGSRRTVGVIAGVGGLVTGAVAGYYGLRTLSLVRASEAHCYPDGTCESSGLDILDRARQMQRTAFVLAGVGAAATAVGVVLVLTNGRGRRDRASGVGSPPRGERGLALEATMNATGIGAQVRW
jgi:hypothetical protein